MSSAGTTCSGRCARWTPGCGCCAGERFTFDEESRALYDAVAPTHGEDYFARTLSDLDARLPGTGPVPERHEAFKRQFVVAPDRLDRVFGAAIDACRARTRDHLALPAGERFTVEYVTGKSWSGYNWYQGGATSLIQVNTDLPIYIDRAIDLAAHEGYPGHHVYNALLEEHLVRGRGWIEFTVYALFSPQSLIAEGTANFGIDVAFPGPERVAFERDHLFPLAGLDPARAEDYYATLALTDRLAYAGNEAARQYLDGRISREAAVDLARDVCIAAARARRAAGAVLRAVPQLRDQLQPRKGPGARLHRGAWRHGGGPCPPLVRVRRPVVHAPPALCPDLDDSRSGGVSTNLRSTQRPSIAAVANTSHPTLRASLPGCGVRASALLTPRSRAAPLAL